MTWGLANLLHAFQLTLSIPLYLTMSVLGLDKGYTDPWGLASAWLKITGSP